MAQEKQEQRMRQELQGQGKISLDSISQYLGKRVVLESNSGHLEIGDFTEYDGKFLTLEDVKSTDYGFNNIRIGLDDPLYKIKRKIVNKSSVDSIQTLDDVMEATEK